VLKRRWNSKRELVSLGVVVKPFGVKGWLKVYPYTNVFENFERKQLYFLDPKPGSEPFSVEIEDARIHSRCIVLKVSGIEDRDSAEKLRNFQVFIPKEELEPLDEDEFYYYEVIGSEVYIGDEMVGEVRDVIESAASEVFVIITPEAKEVLVPVVSEFVEKIDKKASKVFLRKGKVEAFFEV